VRAIGVTLYPERIHFRRAVLHAALDL